MSPSLTNHRQQSMFLNQVVLCRPILPVPTRCWKSPPHKITGWDNPQGLMCSRHCATTRQANSSLAFLAEALAAFEETCITSSELLAMSFDSSLLDDCLLLLAGANKLMRLQLIKVIKEICSSSSSPSPSSSWISLNPESTWLQPRIGRLIKSSDGKIQSLSWRTRRLWQRMFVCRPICFESICFEADVNHEFTAVWRFTVDFHWNQAITNVSLKRRETDWPWFSQNLIYFNKTCAFAHITQNKQKPEIQTNVRTVP